MVSRANDYRPVISCEKTSIDDDDKIEDPQTFKDKPTECECPFCKHEVTTTIEYRTNCTTLLLCFVLFMMFGMIAICVIPFVYSLLQTTRHTCPNCLNVICEKQRIRFPRVSKEVFTLQCGNCAIVLSRKYILVLGCMTVLILVANCLRWYLVHVGIPKLPKGKVLTNSWEDFLNDCGSKVNNLGNPIHASQMFDNIYYGSTVHWDGRVDRIEESVFSVNILHLTVLPMQDVVRASSNMALMFHRDLNKKVADLKIDDKIVFEATLLELGKRGRAHLGVLWDFNLTAISDPNELDEDILQMFPNMFYPKRMTPLGFGTPLIRMIRIVHTDGTDSGFSQQPVKIISSHGFSDDEGNHDDDKSPEQNEGMDDTFATLLNMLMPSASMFNVGNFAEMNDNLQDIEMMPNIYFDNEDDSEDETMDNDGNDNSKPVIVISPQEKVVVVDTENRNNNERVQNNNNNMPKVVPPYGMTGRESAVSPNQQTNTVKTVQSDPIYGNSKTDNSKTDNSKTDNSTTESEVRAESTRIADTYSRTGPGNSATKIGIPQKPTYRVAPESTFSESTNTKAENRQKEESNLGIPGMVGPGAEVDRDTDSSTV